MSLFDDLLAKIRQDEEDRRQNMAPEAPVPDSAGLLPSPGAISPQESPSLFETLRAKVRATEQEAQQQQAPPPDQQQPPPVEGAAPMGGAPAPQAGVPPQIPPATGSLLDDIRLREEQARGQGVTPSPINRPGEPYDPSTFTGQAQPQQQPVVQPPPGQPPAVELPPQPSQQGMAQPPPGQPPAVELPPQLPQQGMAPPAADAAGVSPIQQQPPAENFTQQSQEPGLIHLLLNTLKRGPTDPIQYAELAQGLQDALAPEPEAEPTTAEGALAPPSVEGVEGAEGEPAEPTMVDLSDPEERKRLLARRLQSERDRQLVERTAGKTFEELLEAKQRDAVEVQKRVDELSAIERAVGSFSSRISRGDTPGVLASLMRRWPRPEGGTPLTEIEGRESLSEEDIKTAQAFLDAERGTAGAVGSVLGVLGPPVVDIAMMQASGVTPAARAKHGIPGALVAEEAPFVAGNIADWRGTDFLVRDALIGLGAGGVAEAIADAWRIAKRGKTLAKDPIKRQEFAQQVLGTEQLGPTDLAVAKKAVAKGGQEDARELVDIIDLAMGDDGFMARAMGDDYPFKVGAGETAAEGERVLHAAFRDPESGTVFGRPGDAHGDVLDRMTKAEQAKANRGEFDEGFLTKDPEGEKSFLTRDETEQRIGARESTEVMGTREGQEFKEAFEQRPDEGVRPPEPEEDLPYVEGAGPEDVRAEEAIDGEVVRTLDDGTQIVFGGKQSDNAFYAIKDGEEVGTALPGTDDTFADIRVRPEHQRRGIGTALLQEMKERFPDANYTPVTDAGALLTKSGREVTLKPKGGGWVDLVDDGGEVIEKVQGLDKARGRADELRTPGPREAPERAIEPEPTPRDLEGAEETPGISRNIPEMDRGPAELTPLSPKSKLRAPDPEFPDRPRAAEPPSEAKGPRADETQRGFVDLGTVKRGLGSIRRKYLSHRRDIPEKAFNRIFRHNASLEKEAAGVQTNIMHLRKAVSKAPGMSLEELADPDSRTLQSMDRFFRGDVDAIDHMPANIKRIVSRMRGQVDNITTTMRREGVVQGELATTFAENLGVYLTRTYKLFTDDDFIPDEEMRNQFVSWARDYYDISTDDADQMVRDLISGAGSGWDSMGSMFKGDLGRRSMEILKRRHGFVPNRLRQELRTLGKNVEDLAPKSVDRQIDEWVDGSGDDIFEALSRWEKQNNNLLTGGRKLPKKTAKDLRGANQQIENLRKELVARQEIPAPMRAFLGEEENPLTNYANTVHKMAQNLQTARVLKTVKDHGMRGGWVKTADQLDVEDLKGGKEWVRVAKEGEARWEPLATLGDDVYVKRDQWEGLNAVFAKETLDMGMRLWAKLNGTVKAGMTVGSPETHIRNLVGNAYFGMMNGTLGIASPVNIGKVPGLMGESIQTVRQGFSADWLRTSAAYQQRYEHYVGLGLFNKSARAGPIKDLLDDMTKETFDIDTYVGYGAEGRLKAAIKKTGLTAMDLYQAEDDAWKAMFYEVERAAHIKAYKDAGEAVPSDIDEIAANKVKQTSQNYDMVPEGVKKLRHLPLGAFPQFAWEVLRTTKNSLKIASEEITDPVLRRRGFARLAGTVQAQTFSLGAMASSMKLLGWTADQVEAMLRSQNEYEQNSTPILFSEPGAHDVHWFNVSYNDPSSQMRDPLFAMSHDISQGFSDDGMKGIVRELPGAVINSAVEFFAPLLGADIVPGLTAELLTGYDSFGNKIYEKDENAAVPWITDGALVDIADHIYKQIRPGFVKEAHRTYQDLMGKWDYNQNRPSVLQEMGSNVGFRIKTANLPSQMINQTLDKTDKLTSINQDLGRLLNDDDIKSFEDMKQKFQSLTKSRFMALRDAARVVKDMHVLGFDGDDIDEVLGSGIIGGVRTDEKDAIRGMYYEPPSMSSRVGVKARTRSQARAKTKPDRQEELRSMFERRREWLDYLLEEEKEKAGKPFNLTSQIQR